MPYEAVQLLESLRPPALPSQRKDNLRHHIPCRIDNPRLLVPLTEIQLHLCPHFLRYAHSELLSACVPLTPDNLTALHIYLLRYYDARLLYTCVAQIDVRHQDEYQRLKSPRLLIVDVVLALIHIVTDAASVIPSLAGNIDATSLAHHHPILALVRIGLELTIQLVVLTERIALIQTLEHIRVCLLLR